VESAEKTLVLSPQNHFVTIIEGKAWTLIKAINWIGIIGPIILHGGDGWKATLV